MKPLDTVIIGAGQNGLAMSHELTGRGIEHLVLERGQVANSWRTERWDSLRLLTPNWMNGLPGAPYAGPDPNGFMDMSELVKRFDTCLSAGSYPLRAETNVLSVNRADGLYKVQTDQGRIMARTVVLATGACALPARPAFAADLPASVAQFTPLSYKRPAQLPDGAVMVVGASASGLQLAREAALSGRRVLLAVGNHLRLPRDYRGYDILHWMTTVGLFSERWDAVEDIAHARRTPSLPLMGSLERADLDLNSLQRLGIEITGKLMAIRDGTALFSGSLANLCVAADLKMGRALDQIDAWITENGHDTRVPAPARPAPTWVPKAPRLAVDLVCEGIKSVIWATGYRPDFSWLDLPVFDRKGQLIHDGGVVAEGLFAMGLPYLRRRQSTHIHGAQTDARDLAELIAPRSAVPNAA